VEAGPARQIFASPRHPYTQALLAAALNLEAVDDGAVSV
jgi:microcin C transport system ATP-binding protein